jgi:hypothetical protein
MLVFSRGSIDDRAQCAIIAQFSRTRLVAAGADFYRAAQADLTP